MPIYSKNRPVHTPAVVESSKVYGSTDAGVVLYESCVNDSILFNAMIDHDMNEIKAIKEGTILEAEIESLNEEAQESLKTKLVEKLQGLWRKIKEMLGDITAKIASYVMKNGKAFADRFVEVRDEYEKNKKSEASIKAIIPDFSFKYPVIPTDIEKGVDIGFAMDNDARSNALAANKVDKTELIKKELGIASGAKNPMTPDEFREYISKNSFREAELTPKNSNVNQMLDYMTSAKDGIKAVKEYEKAAKTAIDNNISVVKKDKKAENYATKLALVTATEQVILTITREAISVIRSRYSVSRKALGALMGTMRTAMNESTEYSMMNVFVEAAVELDEVFDAEPGVVSPEIQEYIDSIA